jgi:hypothetical protein
MIILRRVRGHGAISNAEQSAANRLSQPAHAAGHQRYSLCIHVFLAFLISRLTTRLGDFACALKKGVDPRPGIPQRRVDFRASRRTLDWRAPV